MRPSWFHAARGHFDCRHVTAENILRQKDFTELGTNPLINASKSTDGRDVDLSVGQISLQGPSCLNCNKLD